MRVLSLLTAALLGFVACAALTTAQAPKGKKETKKDTKTEKKEPSQKDFKPVTDIGGKTFNDVLKEITSSDRSVGAQALNDILAFGPERAYKALPTILGELKKHKAASPIDPSFRINAPRTLYTILSNVRLPDPKKDKEAAEASYKKLSEELKDTVNLLKAMAADTQLALRFRAIQVLTMFGPVAKDAVGVLIQRAGDTSTWEIRNAAVTALGVVAREWDIPKEKGKGKGKGITKGKGSDEELHKPKLKAPDVKVTGALYPRLHDSSSAVRLSAIQALQMLGVPELPGERGKSYEEQLGRIASPLTSDKNRDAMPLVRIAAHVALYQVKSKRQIGLQEKRRVELAKFLTHKLTAVKVNAIQALGGIGKDAEDQVPALVKVVENDKDKDVAATAIWNMGSIGKGSEKARKEVIKYLANEDARFRGEACHALGAIGPEAKEAVPQVRKLLKDKDEAVAVQAVRTIASILGEGCISEMEVISADKTMAESVRDEAKGAVEFFQKMKKDKEAQKKVSSK
jgi:HEAT repeat protein